MTLAKSSALKPSNETLLDRRTKLPGAARTAVQGGQGVEQQTLEQAIAAQGAERDGLIVSALEQHPVGAAGAAESSAFILNRTTEVSVSSGELARGESSADPFGASALTWQSQSGAQAVDFALGLNSFTTLAQAPASVLSDLPAKQAESIAASAPGLSLPMAGLAAVGAVIAGVAGGSSSSGGTPVDPAQKALDDKLDAIKLGLKVDSGLDSKDGVTKNGALELKDATSGTTLAAEPTGLQFSTDGGKTWVSSLSGFAPVEGANSVILRLQGDKGLVSKSSSAFTFTLDTVAPSTPVVGLKSDSGSNTSDQITNSVTGAADLTTKALDAGVRIEVSAKADGVFSPTFTPAEGVNTVQIRAVDLAGNASPASLPFTFTFDSKVAVPTVGIAPGSVNGALNDSGSSSTDGLTKVTSPVLAGTAERNSKLSIELANGATSVKVDTTVDATDKWQVALPSGTGLADGTPQATVTITDPAGNTASSKAAAAFTIDTKAPLASQIKAELVHDKTNDDGDSQTDGITSNQSPFLSGTAEAGSTVAISFAGVTGSTPAVVGADGKWSAQVKLDSGTWTPIVQATDAAGNTSDPVSGTAFTIKQNISAVLKHDAVNDTGVSASDNVTYNTFPTLVGYSLPSASVKIALAGQTYDTKTAADGTWSVNVKSLLADGDYTPTIATLGVAGVSETPINGTKFTVDTKAPDPSGVTVTLDSASDTGVSKVDGLTSNASPTLSGKAPAGALVSLSLSGGADGAAPTTVSVKDPVAVGTDGTWSSAVKLSAGTWTPSVLLSDRAGNEGGSVDGASFTIVTQAATSTISLDSGSETGNSQDPSLNDGVTSNALPTLSGTVDAMRDGTTVLVTLGSASGTATPDSSGAWTFTPSKVLADGSYSASVIVKDAVGLDSTPIVAAQKIVIDTAAPVLVHQPDLVKTEGSAFSVAPAYGKFATTDDVLFEDVGGYLTTIGFAFTDGTGAVTATKGWALSEGSPTFGWVRATVTDLAGNISVDEFQVAGVSKSTSFTTSSATVDEADAFAPTLYVDKAGNNLTLTLTATVGSVIQLGDGNDTVKLDATDFYTMNFAALDGGAGTGDVLSLNTDTANGLAIDLGTFNQAGFGDGKVLTRFELLKFNTTADNAGTLTASPGDLYRQASDLIDTVADASSAKLGVVNWSTLVVSGDDNDTVSLVSIDLSPTDGVDQDFYQVGDAGKFSATGAAGTGYTKLRAVVVDADGSHGVELLVASAVTIDAGGIELQRAYPVLG